MKLGSTQHKTEFLTALKKEYIENIWKNELHILRLQTEIDLIEAEHKKLSDVLADKGKPAASAEEKQLFVLNRTLEHKRKEREAVEATKQQNEYGLNSLIPQYEQSA